MHTFYIKFCIKTMILNPKKLIRVVVRPYKYFGLFLFLGKVQSALSFRSRGHGYLPKWPCEKEIFQTR